MPPIRILTPAEDQAALLGAVIKSFEHAAAHSAPGEDVAAKVINNVAARELARLITADPGMLTLKRKVTVLANQHDPVLVTGPSGTGKEIIARALHGFRPADKFFAVNCAAMPEQLIESELFGHKAGSFTGATGDRVGILESAHGGTVFLDEIGEAPLALQAKLLRVLQPAVDGQYYIRRVGDTKYIAINCRIVAASKIDLWAAIEAKQFREDLYGRLMAFELYTTPLASRPLDIPMILDSLGVPPEDQDNIHTPEWQRRVDQFNVRALQAYARRRKVWAQLDE